MTTRTATTLAVAMGFVLTACGSSDSPATSVPTSSPPAAASSLPATTAPSTTVAATTSTTTVATTTTAAPATTSTTNTTVVMAPLVAVPPGEPPAVDGVMEPDEWEGAAVVEMSDGAAARLLYSNETLYVGVAGKAIGSVNVVIAGDENLSILHSSAALGSAAYTRNGPAWELVHGFDWCCRRGSDESARTDLFDREGWVANIGYDGDPGVVEYAIAIPWRDTSLAISTIRSESDKGFWPAGLSPEAQDQLVGVPPPTREYYLHEWGTISAGSAD